MILRMLLLATLLLSVRTSQVDAQSTTGLPRHLPASVHFEIEVLAEGVWAAIASDSGYAISNAGIVDLGAETLVFDPFISPEAARDLRVAAEILTRRPVTYVVLSHWHNDHIRGAQSFPGATVVGTSMTRSLIAAREPAEIRSEREGVPRALEDAVAAIERAPDASSRREAVFWWSYYEAMLRSHDLLLLTLPAVTFEHRFAFHGDERTVELIEFRGHTESDVVLWLPREGIAFMGDLLFVERHPYLPDGDPNEHRETLRAVAELGPDQLVPGHGPVSGAASVFAMIRYIDALEALGRRFADENLSADEIRRTEPPAAYRTWWYRKFLPPNLLFMTERAAEASSPPG